MTETEKKTRRKVGYQVQSCHSPSTGTMCWADEGDPHVSQAAALKWLTGSANKEKLYTIVRVIWGPHKIVVKTVERRTFA